MYDSIQITFLRNGRKVLAFPPIAAADKKTTKTGRTVRHVHATMTGLGQVSLNVIGERGK